MVEHFGRAERSEVGWSPDVGCGDDRMGTMSVLRETAVSFTSIEELGAGVRDQGPHVISRTLNLAPAANIGLLFGTLASIFNFIRTSPAQIWHQSTFRRIVRKILRGQMSSQSHELEDAYWPRLFPYCILERPTGN